MKVKAPCGHNVLIKLKKTEKTTKGGIILSDSLSKRETRGTEEATVIMLGPQAYKGFDDGTPWCKPGDKVAIVQYEGRDIVDGDDIYRVLPDDRIVAILNEDEENE